MPQKLTRDDVFLSEPRKIRIVPGILRGEVVQLTVGRQRYQVQTTESWLIGNRTTVFPAAECLVSQDSPDVEQAVAALLDVLNSQADGQG